VKVKEKFWLPFESCEQCRKLKNGGRTAAMDAFRSNDPACTGFYGTLAD
jgi:hypothetical protein